MYLWRLAKESTLVELKKQLSGAALVTVKFRNRTRCKDHNMNACRWDAAVSFGNVFLFDIIIIVIIAEPPGWFRRGKGIGYCRLPCLRRSPRV